MQPRLQQISWFSLGVLVVSGMFQMSANPFYQGALVIRNNWAIAILLKHLAVGVMFLIAGYQTWGLNPAMRRLALRLAASKPVDPSEGQRLRHQETLLLRINLSIAIIVLLLTAWARAS